MNVDILRSSFRYVGIGISSDGFYFLFPGKADNCIDQTVDREIAENKSVFETIIEMSKSIIFRCSPNKVPNIQFSMDLPTELTVVYPPDKTRKAFDSDTLLAMMSPLDDLQKQKLIEVNPKDSMAVLEFFKFDQIGAEKQSVLDFDVLKKWPEFSDTAKKMFESAGIVDYLFQPPTSGGDGGYALAEFYIDVCAPTVLTIEGEALSNFVKLVEMSDGLSLQGYYDELGAYMTVSFYI